MPEKQQFIRSQIILSIFLVFSFYPVPAQEEPFFEAARNGDLETVKAIIEEDPSRFEAIDNEKYTALHWACIREQWDVAKLKSRVLGEYVGKYYLI